MNLYYRKNGQFIEGTKTDAAGAYRFNYLDEGDYYYVVALDTDVPPNAYNAKVFDFVQPVPIA